MVVETGGDYCTVKPADAGLGDSSEIRVILYDGLLDAFGPGIAVDCFDQPNPARPIYIVLFRTPGPQVHLYCCPGRVGRAARLALTGEDPVQYDQPPRGHPQLHRPARLPLCPAAFCLLAHPANQLLPTLQASQALEVSPDGGLPLYRLPSPSAPQGGRRKGRMLDSLTSS